MEFTPYSTGADLFGQKPAWISNALDQQRILSYELYEKIYWTVPDVFRLSIRGTNNAPIYIPSARTIVDTTNRYVAPQFAVSVRDRDTGSDTTDVIAARLALQDWFARERFRSKFNGTKRFGLIQGDWIWHITADPSKPIGSRVSIVSLDPSMYFPVFDENNVERVIGCHLVELTERNGDQVVRRQTYMKTDPGGVTVSDGYFELDKWEDLDAQPIEVIRAEESLPDQITSLPVYHIKNFEEPGNPFGSSELRGFERLMSAINQTVSDEDLALALDGLGMYATDAPQPTDRQGNPIAWQLGPGRVVHRPPDTRWERITGIGTVAPFGDHYDRLWEAIKQASSTPDIAIGTVDVQIAQSGIALSLQLGPMLAKAGERNDLIIDVHNQMFFDLLNMWYPAYEQTTFNNVAVSCVVGDAVPVDREARFKELNDMLDKGVIDTQYYRDEATKLGYVFPADIQERVDAELAKRDEFGARLNRELGEDSDAGSGTE